MAPLKLKLEKNQNRTVYFIDLDDTLFESDCRVYIKDPKTGKRVQELTPAQYNHFEKQKDMEDCIDFSDFSSAELFVTTGKPILPTLNKLVKIINNIIARKKKDKIVILTSRPDFDDREKILTYFSNFGIPVHNEELIQIVRCGNVSDKLWSTAEKKQIIVASYLFQNKYKNFIMWDDNVENLKRFYQVKSISFKPVNFSIGHVVRKNEGNGAFIFELKEKKNGSVQKYFDEHDKKVAEWKKNHVQSNNKQN